MSPSLSAPHLSAALNPCPPRLPTLSSCSELSLLKSRRPMQDPTLAGQAPGRMGQTGARGSRPAGSSQCPSPSYPPPALGHLLQGSCTSAKWTLEGRDGKGSPRHPPTLKGPSSRMVGPGLHPPPHCPVARLSLAAGISTSGVTKAPLHTLLPRVTGSPWVPLSQSPPHCPGQSRDGWGHKANAETLRKSHSSVPTHLSGQSSRPRHPSSP